MRRAWAALPERVRGPVREIRHGRSGAQETAAQRLRVLAADAGRAQGVGERLIGPCHRPRRATVVTSYDAWGERAGVVAALVEILEHAGIWAVVPPMPGNRAPLIVVSASDAARARLALANARASRDWWVVEETEAGRTTPRPSKLATDGTADPVALLCFRYLCSPSGVLLNDESWHVRLEFWPVVPVSGLPRPDGGEMTPGTRVAQLPNTRVAYLEPEEWEAATDSPTRWLPGTPNEIREFVDPVDVVYTWVDGSDPAWLERKLRAQGLQVHGEHHADSLAANRFISRDELRYSLRSVEMYASWVNHIWIVTDRQVPGWLDTSNPRITVVDHREIFSDPGALPVFNSHAIETQLHHIDGLSEHYIYMNDDVFFGRPVRPETFFHANGISRFFPSTAVLDVTPRSARDFAVASAGKRNRELIERDFGRTLTNKLRHTPLPQNRRILAEMEERYPDIFDSVMRSTFRHPDDYAVPSSLFQWYAFATGRAVDGRVIYGYQDIAAANAGLVLSKWLRERRLECFCLNDTADDPDSADARDRVVVDFLERYFPVPSGLERTNDGGA